MVRISLYATTDPKHLQDFLQYVRTFQSAQRREMRIQLHVDGGDMNRAELTRILYSLNPSPFEFVEEEFAKPA